MRVLMIEFERSLILSDLESFLREISFNGKFGNEFKLYF